MEGEEEEEGPPGSRGEGSGGTEGSQKEELGELAANKGNRDGDKGRSQAFSNHFGTLGRKDCPGGTKSLGSSL